MKILYLDDDRFLLDLARHWLEDAGHQVATFETGQAAIDAIHRESFDLAILDRHVPGVPGDEVLRWVRTHHPRMPVIFATLIDAEDEVARILNLGADDYLVKPLRRVEFLARVGAVARRAGVSDDHADAIDAPPYRVDLKQRTISLDGAPVKLTPRQFQLASLLFENRNELVTRPQIFLQVWGQSDVTETRTVDTHVSRLRQLLELDGRHGWKLVSIYQHGYRLEMGSG